MVTTRTNSSRSYRCHYNPRPDEPCESGVLPHLQVQAPNAEQAHRLAFATIGKPIVSCERIEAVEVYERYDPLTDTTPWPLPPALEDTLARAAAKADERRFLEEPHTPSAFGALA